MGFTLIEVLLVIVVVGIMVAAIQINFSTSKPDEQLHKESVRFAHVFNAVAEFGLLNNLELGLYTSENSYQFVGYDGVRWSPLEDNQLLALYQLPDAVEIRLIFDDLPLEQPNLIEADLFIPDDEQLEQMQDEMSEDEKPIIPQVYILSGGDITPFRVEFTLVDNDFLEQDIRYAVQGLYTTPVTVIGPIIDGVEPSGAQYDN